MSSGTSTTDLAHIISAQVTALYSIPVVCCKWPSPYLPFTADALNILGASTSDEGST